MSDCTSQEFLRQFLDCQISIVATYRLHEQFMKSIGESVENEDPTKQTA